jgi:hypothetical protein
MRRNTKERRMLMLEQMKWEDVYELWKRGSYKFPKILTEPVSAETVYVEYEQRGGYIYGYDWLEASEAQEKKQLIEKTPMEFLYLTKYTNKGAIQTAEMLVEARSEEELAAVWIAATSKELCAYRSGSGVGRYASMLYIAAYEFLSDRYFLWNHAMKRLVPKIMIPSGVLKNMVCKDPEPVIGLIQMNTVMLKSTWNILRYSSLKNGEVIASKCRRSPK